MDGPVKNPAEHDMSGIPSNLDDEEQANPYSDVMCQNSTRKNRKNPYAEEPKNPSYEESRNPYNEEQANVSYGNVGDQHKEDQSVSPQGPSLICCLYR